ncbi:MAG: hypothetical protein ACT4P4_11785 [Betaproteobacteria bacterium]
MAAADFDAFVTVDKKLHHQQNLSKLPVAVVLLDAPSNELAFLLPLVPNLERVLSSLKPKTHARVAKDA